MVAKTSPLRYNTSILNKKGNKMSNSINEGLYTLSINGKSVVLADYEMDIIFEAINEFRASDVEPETCDEIISKLYDLSGNT
jgi:hypothetical protein